MTAISEWLQTRTHHGKTRRAQMLQQRAAAGTLSLGNQSSCSINYRSSICWPAGCESDSSRATPSLQFRSLKHIAHILTLATAQHRAVAAHNKGHCSHFSSLTSLRFSVYHAFYCAQRLDYLKHKHLAKADTIGNHTQNRHTAAISPLAFVSNRPRTSNQVTVRFFIRFPCPLEANLPQYVG